jgi:hypothetical protein
MRRVRRLAAVVLAFAAALVAFVPQPAQAFPIVRWFRQHKPARKFIKRVVTIPARAARCPGGDCSVAPMSSAPSAVEQIWFAEAYTPDVGSPPDATIGAMTSVDERQLLSSEPLAPPSNSVSLWDCQNGNGSSRGWGG